VKKIIVLFVTIVTVLSASAQVGNELYRPAYHYTPAYNWMSDPNGLVFYNGKYHIFYQYNPYGINWGNMSWGHAVSTNLLNWEEQPVAIPAQNGMQIFSGSMVVDWNNTSGFGKDGKPAMVAIYTGVNNTTNIQDQRLAYSNDEGITWTNFEMNPVLSLGNKNFRDPKVFWHKETEKWIMVVSLGDYRRLRIYNSPNLKTWNLLQDFMPFGNQSGFWECPDLFELPVNDDATDKKWVLMHSVGTHSQYFIGDFDGEKFSWENKMPEGILIDDFENETYDSWVAEGDAFGLFTATGSRQGQQYISGFLGKKIANSFVVNNADKGKLISSPFTIQKKNIGFLLSGGNYPDGTYIKLIINGQVVRKSTGLNENFMRWRNWDVSEWFGQTAHIEIVDSVNSGWGHISVDHIIQTDNEVATENYGSIDFGKDFYAAQSFSDIPGTDGRRIWLAWMSNWNYSAMVPTNPWKGTMTIPREVKIVKVENQLKLVQVPVKELMSLRKNELKFTNASLSHINNAFQISVSNILASPAYKQFELKAKIAVTNQKGFSIRFKKHGIQFTEFIFDFINKEIRFNRGRSGVLSHDNYFRNMQSAPLITKNGYFDFHLFVDNSSAELFSGDGQVVMTNQIFPDSISNKIELIALEEDIVFEKFQIWKLGKPGPQPATPIDEQPLFDVYPNPVVNGNGLTIKIKDEYIGKLNFRLYSPDGKLIYEFQPTTYSIIIPRNKMAQAKGLYVLTATDGINTQSEKLTVMGY
jgi:sucrose-6-phosphate hydrolase SacC (GH32 family)